MGKPYRRPENLDQWKAALGLKQSSEGFRNLRKAISTLLEEILPPQHDLSRAENAKGVQKVTAEIAYLFPELFQGDENKKRRRVVRVFISRERIQRQSHWRRVNRKRKIKRLSKPILFPESVVKSDIIDLTLDSSDADSDLSDIDDDPDSDDMGSVEPQKIKQEPSEEREIGIEVLASQPPQPDVTTGTLLIERKAISAPTPGIAMASTPITPISAPIQGLSFSAIDGRAQIEHFLSQCTPSMLKFSGRLWDLGVRSQNDLRTISQWSITLRRHFLEKLGLAEVEGFLTEFKLSVLEHSFAQFVTH